jgi:small subunit ribosomal protein S1
LWQGYIKKIKEEFIEQIKNPTKAYTAKIVQVNKGGYFVEVQGLEAFMPGSLAAANKLADFKTLMGKEVIVMIEDFLPEMNSFIVSHKKYIEYVLPSKLKQLDLNSKFSGIITGCSKYGIFVEFRSDAEESSIKFTGLLHISKMTDETKAKFESYGYAAGDSIEFYIGEITKDNRIILDEENPVSKLAKLECFVEENSGKLLEATIGSILNFGIIVNIDSISGLIPARQFAMHRVLMKNFIIGDTISVYIDEIRENKLVLKLQEVRS